MPGTTYYWRVISRTMANLNRNRRRLVLHDRRHRSAATQRHRPAPATSCSTHSTARSRERSGRSFPTPAAGGAKRLWNMNAGAAKITTAAARPASYVDLTFHAVPDRHTTCGCAGAPKGNIYPNDSVFVQFSNSVTSAAQPTLPYRHDLRGRVQPGGLQRLRHVRVGLAGQRVGLRRDGCAHLLQHVGPQTMRIQSREDGLSIDQIILSPATGILLRFVAGRVEERHDDLRRDAGIARGIGASAAAASAAAAGDAASAMGRWRHRQRRVSPAAPPTTIRHPPTPSRVPARTCGAQLTRYTTPTRA